MANFALIGAAGYIAPRHLKAIADTGNTLLAAYDKFDSVGRLDSYFPECSFFTEQEQFDRFCSKQQRSDNPLQWLSICTPNYTHDAFIRYGLRLGCDVICEKPLVLNPYNIDNLIEMEKETGHKAYTILQLRRAQERRRGDQYRRAFLRYAAMGVRSCAEKCSTRDEPRPCGGLSGTTAGSSTLFLEHQCRLPTSQRRGGRKAHLQDYHD